MNGLVQVASSSSSSSYVQSRTRPAIDIICFQSRTGTRTNENNLYKQGIILVNDHDTQMFIFYIIKRLLLKIT